MMGSKYNHLLALSCITVLLGTVVCASVSQAQRPPVTPFVGEVNANSFGGSVSDAGDVNADGFDDFIVGSVGETQCLPSLELSGETAGDDFGISVSVAGDVNNDGFVDLIVGAIGNDAGGSFAGRAYVYSGLTWRVLYTFTGEEAKDYFGCSVSGAGDVDSDDYDDLIVGAYGHDAAGTISGRAYVYSGQTGELLHTFTGEAIGDRFGSSVSGAGDVNNDGYADIIIGAHTSDSLDPDFGRAYVFSGKTGESLHTFIGANVFAKLGHSVSGIGDIDKDGYDDLLVGEYGYNVGGSRKGRVFVFSGKTGVPLLSLTGRTGGDEFGWSVSGAGDVNLDGYPDLIVGARGVDFGRDRSGRAFVFSGKTGEELLNFVGLEVGEQMGYSVSGAGDVNDDGYPDLIVGSNGTHVGELNIGRVRVFSGKNGALLYDFAGEATRDKFGTSVSGAGDFNQDGFFDLIAGAYWYGADGKEAGRIHVYFLGESSGEGCDCCDTAGDADNNGVVNIGDVTFLITRVFLDGPAPVCGLEGDTDSSGSINIGDVTFLISHIFSNGDAPGCD